MNKKVTLNGQKDLPPVFYRYSPIYNSYRLLRCVFLKQEIINVMKNKDHIKDKNKELHPRIGVGLFLITLGLALLIATNDLLGLGSVREYFTWETAMIFIGALLILNLQFTGGVVLIALGAWFFMENRDYEVPEIIRTLFWPSVIIVIGLGFIISSIIKKQRKGI
jgi:hypothetical protein